MISTLSDKELAKVIWGSKCTPFSYKSIQAEIRAGNLKARKVNRVWVIEEENAKDWLSYRNGQK